MYKLPRYFLKMYKFPLFAFNLRFICIIYVSFASHLFLTIMHLCIMHYTYWTLLDDRSDIFRCLGDLNSEHKAT